MTDKELYKLCKKWGRKTLRARYRFEGLLPEVNKRRLYEKRGLESIYVFAAKLAGMNREQVDKVLRLEKRFEAMPDLHGVLVKGEVSANKLVRIASIATVKNQKDLAEKTKTFSNRALEAFVADFRSENSSSEPKQRQESLHVQSLKLDNDIENELLTMQKRGIDINTFLRKALETRKLEIAQQKEELAGKQTDSRYIPAAVIKVVALEHGTKCSIPHCNKPAKILHHTARFSLSHSHDPRFLAPLCKGHHEFAHMIDVKVQAKAVKEPPRLASALT